MKYFVKLNFFARFETESLHLDLDFVVQYWEFAHSDFQLLGTARQVFITSKKVFEILFFMFLCQTKVIQLFFFMFLLFFRNQSNLLLTFNHSLLLEKFLMLNFFEIILRKKKFCCVLFRACRGWLSIARSTFFHLPLNAFGAF